MVDDVGGAASLRAVPAAVNPSSSITSHRYSGLFPVRTRLISERGRRGLDEAETKKLQYLVDRAARGLNFMHGELDRPVPVTEAGGTGKRHVLQKLTQRRLEESARSWISAVSALDAEESLRGLLKGRSVYDIGGCPNLASYSSARLKLPEGLDNSPYIEDVCSVPASNMLKDFVGNMLRPSAEARAIKESFPVIGHVDPILRNNRAKYIQLLKKALHSNLISLTKQCECECGVFFVKKKDSTIRLILDCRPANQLFS